MRKEKLFIKILEDFHLTITKIKKIYKYLRRKKVGVLILLLVLFLFFLLLLLLLFLLSLDQLGVNIHFLDVKVGMETTDLPFVEVKALAEVLGSHKFNNFLKII